MSDNQDTLPPMPAPLEFMLRTPLYEWYVIPGVDEWNALAFLSGRHDLYCVHCNQVTLFERKSLYSGPAHMAPSRDASVPSGWRRIELTCLKAHHVYDFWFLVSSNRVTKAGQFPSLADLQVADRRKYVKLLGRQRVAELTRADGLAAHGVGIGSFVYLRRIFESLVDEAHELEKSDKGWNEDVYQRARMDEKIRMLSHQLPDFLVENRAIYGILSKGIHELSEEECLAFHAAIRTGIEIILDEKLEANARAKRLADAKSDLANAVERANRPTPK